MGNKASWGIIFDFDGVLVDTTALHERCWIEMAEKENKLFTHENFLLGIGVKPYPFVRDILRWTTDHDTIVRIIQKKEETFQGLIQEVTWLPGIFEFVQELYKQKIPFAIGSSSIRKNIDLILARSPLRPFFTKMIGGEDVTKGKPDPEVFIKAAELLRLPKERCIVIEDGLVGIEAAKKAGCKAFALLSTFEKQAFLEQKYIPDMLFTSFKELSIEKIAFFME